MARLPRVVVDLLRQALRRQSVSVVRYCLKSTGL